MNGGRLPQHAFLERFLGEWTYGAEVSPAPGEPAVHVGGTETARMLGDLWVVVEGDGDMPDGSRGITLMTLGYDPQGERYVGTWVGSMMNYLWTYDGELEAGGTKLTLATRGPGMDGKTIIPYRDVHEFQDDDHRTLTSFMQGEDGSWTQIMSVPYLRRR